MKNIWYIIAVIFVLVIIIVIGIFCWLFGCTPRKGVAGAEERERSGMYVDGTVLRKADGSPFVMRGINHAHCWYQDKDIVALDAISETGANCVRIVCSSGVKWETDTRESIKTILEETRKRNMVAVLEVHDGTGEDDIESLEKIADFWIEIADVLKGSENQCIVNIANEWMGSWNSDKWRDGYCKVIPRLREAGIKNVIMVDAAGWGQYARSVRKCGKEVFESDPDRNTMFSVHMYGMSGRYEWLIDYNIEGATDQNLCICVGEFGYTHSDGDVKFEYLMKYCEENAIGYLAWSWKGNGGGVEYLDMSRDWEGTNLSPEWGYKAINGEYGIRNTAK